MKLKFQLSRRINKDIDLNKERVELISQRYCKDSNNYEIMDLRNLSYEYFSKAIIKAGELIGRKDLVIIQSFEPYSLIKFLSDKGWVYKIEKLVNENYKVLFHHPRNNELNIIKNHKIITYN
jgi:ADP-heptose:LPS heptosyltransferase